MRRKSSEKQEVERDALGYMPERFTAGYYELVRLGLQTDPNGQQFDNQSAAPKKKYHQHAGGLRDEAALRFKAWVDRQLRAIGRDVQAYLNARDSTGPSPIGMSSAQRREIARDLERKTELKCHGCGRYISWQWNHCAWCGKGIHVSGQQEERSDGIESTSTGEQTPAAGGEQHARGGAGSDVDPEDGAASG